MTDPEIIQAAYAEEMRKLFSIYVENAIGNEPALDRFKKGLAILRKCRDECVEEVKRETIL